MFSASQPIRLDVTEKEQDDKNMSWHTPGECCKKFKQN